MAGSNNIKAQMRKGILEYLIMLCLKDHPAYSSDLISMLREGKFIVVEGALYPLLMRLKQNGLLNYIWVESTMGPPRKYYSLTEQGLTFLQELEEAYGEIERAVNFVKNTPMKECSINSNKIISK
jgi:PadR family transcriptional regulator PadR